MAHPSESPEAVATPASDDDAAALAAFDDYLSNEDDDLPDDGDESDGDAPDDTDLDEGDEAEPDDADSDEPSEAIAAPVSLNAEEKAVFAQLPPEAQRAWSASETRRNSQVQEATTKAAHAQRSAEALAAEAHSKAKAVFAEQLAQLASHLAPVLPDAELARANPGEYIAQKAQYDAAKAQHDTLVQQVGALGDEASQEMNQAFIQHRERELLAIPEVANEATRMAFFEQAFETAESLGYDGAVLLQNGDASDFKALSVSSGWKEKAAKYDAIMAKQMQRVRNAKTAKPGAAQPQGSSTARALAKSTTRLRETGDDADALAAFEAMGY